eukprot:CAMPEP_0171545670 /NCGR_PEP_ID=MMETSP0960-20121227/4207_1 /TAXON_ID=87120 /ORGANISM="Aurantiochytrium limacinum, Strain ATCCMYA-1381" /LENGTH=594 /DNA_ID=CAMNT_0012093659 /DNA_START=22 /DNA_END=1806 /DNA_ORIENTATION=-
MVASSSQRRGLGLLALCRGSSSGPRTSPPSYGRLAQRYMCATSNSGAANAATKGAAGEGSSETDVKATMSGLPPVRTRYAPSPTGSLHLGGLRTALFNYLLARKHGPESTFLVRIEDTDRTRTIPGAAEGLLKTLEMFGLKSDEPVQSQSNRTELYKKHADELLENGHAYRCFCSPERLTEVREQQSRRGMQSAYDRRCRGISKEESDERAASGEVFTVRLRAPLTGRTQVDDVVCGQVTFDNKVMDDQILLKSDGFPTYHLAAVVDDHDMKITHVIRGEEWLSSTPKHLTLYEMFGWEAPKFGHLPLLLNKDRSKLSKRNADSAVTELLDGEKSGYSTMAILNFVALLGWSPAQAAMQSARGDQDGKDWLAGFDSVDAPSGDDARESMIFTDLDSLAQAFDLAHTTRKGAVVDPDFLHWLSGQHVRRMDRSILVESVRKQMKWDTSMFSDEYVNEVLDLILFRVFRTSDLRVVAGQFFVPLGQAGLVEGSDVVPEQVNNHEVAQQSLANSIHAFSNLSDEDFIVENIKPILKAMPKDLSKSRGSKVKVPQVMLSIRWAVTGSTVGASLPETLALLGRDRVIERLQHAAKVLEA